MAKKHPGAVALGKLGGRAKSAAKRRAAKANGKLGGRSPKFVVGDRVMVANAAPKAVRGGTGVIVGRSERRAHYQVNISGATRDLPGWWLTRK